MKKKIVFLLFLFFTGIWCYGGYMGLTWIPIGKPARKRQIKIACIGDSITYGCMIKNWFRFNYPHVLGKKLGKGFCVHNYGFSGRTAMVTGDYPYVREYRYKRSLHFKPDIVLLKLGTNDSKSINWRGPEAFQKDYETLMKNYLSLPSKPTVYLLTPATPHYKNGETEGSMSFDIRKPQIMEEILIIKKLADTYHLPFIDIFSLTKNHPEWFAHDGVHPNATGAAAIADAIYEKIKLDFPAFILS